MTQPVAGIDTARPRVGGLTIHAGPAPLDLEALTQQLAVTAPLNDAQGVFPHQNFALLHRRGLLGLAVGQELGGGGAGLAQSREVVAAVARGCASTALVLVMQYAHTRALSRAAGRWPTELRLRVLHDVVREGALTNALRVEPELGTPARGGLPATVARRTEGGWWLSGHKIYSTGIDGLNWLLVWARTDETPVRTGYFLVPRGASGIQVLPTWNALGLRASGSHDVILSDVLLPEDHALDIRPPEAWLAAPDAENLQWLHVLLGTLYDAIGQNARDWLVGFLHERKPSALGAALATVPRVQEALGEIELLLQSNRLQLDAAAGDADAGRLWPAPALGLLKVAVTRNAIEAVDRAMNLSGNHGIARINPLERHHRDVLCGRIHTPQDDSACGAAGRAALQGGA